MIYLAGMFSQTLIGGDEARNLPQPPSPHIVIDTTLSAMSRSVVELEVSPQQENLAATVAYCVAEGIMPLEKQYSRCG
jgi:hypothetical protein